MDELKKIQTDILEAAEKPPTGEPSLSDLLNELNALTTSYPERAKLVFAAHPELAERVLRFLERQ